MHMLIYTVFIAVNPSMWIQNLPPPYLCTPTFALTLIEPPSPVNYECSLIKTWFSFEAAKLQGHQPMLVVALYPMRGSLNQTLPWGLGF